MFRTGNISLHLHSCISAVQVLLNVKLLTSSRTTRSAINLLGGKEAGSASLVLTFLIVLGLFAKEAWKVWEKLFEVSYRHLWSHIIYRARAREARDLFKDTWINSSKCTEVITHLTTGVIHTNKETKSRTTCLWARAGLRRPACGPASTSSCWECQCSELRRRKPCGNFYQAVF